MFGSWSPEAKKSCFTAVPWTLAFFVLYRWSFNSYAVHAPPLLMSSLFFFGVWGFAYGLQLNETTGTPSDTLMRYILSTFAKGSKGVKFNVAVFLLYFLTGSVLISFYAVGIQSGVTLSIPATLLRATTINGFPNSAAYTFEATSVFLDVIFCGYLLVWILNKFYMPELTNQAAIPERINDSEELTKRRLYNAFFKDRFVIPEYYRVLTKYRVMDNDIDREELARRLQPFADMVLLVCGDEMYKGYPLRELQENQIKEDGAALALDPLFRNFPFSDITEKEIKALPFPTLTGFILDTVGKAFDLSPDDLTPDATTIEQHIQEDFLKKYNKGEAAEPLSPEEVSHELIGDCWWNKYREHRDDFRENLRVMEERFDDNTRRALSDNEYLMYGAPVPVHYYSENDRKNRTSAYACGVDYKNTYKHAYIIGKTGSGKTTLIRNLAAQHIRNGQGFIMISPESDPIDQALDYIPPERQNDLVYFNPFDTDPPCISLNPLTLEPGEQFFERVGEVYAVLEHVTGNLGESMRTLLTKSVYTLLQIPGASLKDFQRLLSPAGDFRQAVIQNPNIEPDTRDWWRDNYESKSGYYKKSAEALLNRLEVFFMPPLSKTLTSSSFSLSKAFNEQKSIFLFDLSRAKGIQAEATGQLIVSMFLQALLTRDKQREAQRLPYHLIIDEFQTFAGESISAFTKLLNQARKYRMSVTLAHQVTANIPSELLSTIIGNAETLVCMKRPAEDAAFFARELQLYSEDRAAPNARYLQNLETHEFYLRSPQINFPILLKTELDRFPKVSPPGGRSREEWRAMLKKLSRKNYSQDTNGRPPGPGRPNVPGPNIDDDPEGGFAVT